MPSYRVYILTITRNSRCFSLTTIHHHPSFLDLAARSQTAETAYFRRGSKLSSIEFSPSLQLLRSECELASGKKHIDPTVQETAPKANIAPPSPPKPSLNSAPSPPLPPRPPAAKSTLPPAASPTDFAVHTEHLHASSPTTADPRDARIAQLQRDIATTQAALRAERAARLDDEWTGPGDSSPQQQPQHGSSSSSSGSLIVLVLGGGAAAVVAGALWSAGERDARWWAALRDRYAGHYARATDPARVEPRYMPPVPVRTAPVAAPGEHAPVLALGAVEGGAVAVPVAVVSAAPVPGLVDGGVVEEAKERGKAWKGWFWKS